MALSHLPKTIQSTLDEITKQLNALIPPIKSKLKSVEPEVKAEENNVTTEGEQTSAVTRSKHHSRTLISAETQEHVDKSTETVVEVTSEVHIEEMQSTEEVAAVEEQKQEEDSSIHVTKEDIEEYEESQAKFRALWEKKREAVRELKEHFA